MGASCEPGYNLPDGCTDAAIDRHFGEGKPTCAECAKMYECCCDYAEPSDVAYWALPWIANHMRDMQEEACAMFCG